MVKDKFLRIGDLFLNTDHIVAVNVYEDGSVRIYNSLINEHNPSAPGFMDFEGADATKLVAFFQQNSQQV